jgi:hypothetical protein
MVENTSKPNKLPILPLFNLTKQPSTTKYQLELDDQPPRKILFTEQFIDQSVDRLNTAILDETFQMTVRNRIFDPEEHDKEIFKTAKDEL